MKKIIQFIFSLNFIVIIAQNIHVKYENVISDISKTKEELFISKNETISIRDSIIHFNDTFLLNSEKNFVSTKEKNHKIYYLKSLSENKILIKANFKDILYLVVDEPSPIKWKIDYSKSKKIKQFLSHEATADFRGTKIIAYFTKEIPISAGPFKFSGLPGLILELYEENSNFNSWIVETIDLNYNNFPSINITNCKEISFKNYVELEEKENDAIFFKLTSNLPQNARFERNKIQRQGVEKKYEWE